jgi:hypothetical protein
VLSSLRWGPPVACFLVKFSNAFRMHWWHQPMLSIAEHGCHAASLLYVGAGAGLICSNATRKALCVL